MVVVGARVSHPGGQERGRAGLGREGAMGGCPLPPWPSPPDPGIMRMGELDLPLAGYSTHKSRPCTPPGQQSMAGMIEEVQVSRPQG